MIFFIVEAFSASLFVVLRASIPCPWRSTQVGYQYGEHRGRPFGFDLNTPLMVLQRVIGMDPSRGGHGLTRVRTPVGFLSSAIAMDGSPRLSMNIEKQAPAWSDTAS